MLTVVANIVKNKFESKSQPSTAINAHCLVVANIVKNKFESKSQRIVNHKEGTRSCC